MPAFLSVAEGGDVQTLLQPLALLAMVQNLFPSCHMADSTCCLPSHCLLLHVSSSQGGPGFVPDAVVKLWP